MSSELKEKQEIDFESSPYQPGTPDDQFSDDAHRGTQFDVRDMHRLGKRQEFMVQLICMLCSSCRLYIFNTEKLPLLVDSWLY